MPNFTGSTGYWNHTEPLCFQHTVNILVATFCHFSFYYWAFSFYNAYFDIEDGFASIDYKPGFYFIRFRMSYSVRSFVSP